MDIVSRDEDLVSQLLKDTSIASRLERVNKLYEAGKQ